RNPKRCVGVPKEEFPFAGSLLRQLVLINLARNATDRVLSERGRAAVAVLNEEALLHPRLLEVLGFHGLRHKELREQGGPLGELLEVRNLDAIGARMHLYSGRRGFCAHELRELRILEEPLGERLPRLLVHLEGGNAIYGY